MIKRFILMLLVLGLALGGVAAWKYRQSQQAAAQASQPQPPAVVSSAEVQRERWQRSLRAVGSLVAVQGIHVTNEVAGKVSAINFESGQRVEDSAALVQLDDKVDRAELAGLQAERRLAEIEFQRAAELLKDRSVSRADYDQRRAALEAAEASVAAKRALIEKKTVRAPFSGLLGIREVDLGEFLTPGSPIVQLQVLDPIYVDYALPERHFDRLAPGQAVRVKVQPYPALEFEGRISAINPGVDAGTRTVRLQATLPNPDGRLRSGMFAEVQTLLPGDQEVLTIPRTAVSYAPYGDSVFVVEGGEGGLAVQRKPVQTGAARDGRVEIVAGLAAGDRVVSAGYNKLRNGQAVKIDNSVQLDAQVRSP